MNNLFDKKFYKILQLILAVELFSFLAYQNITIGNILFIIALGAFTWLTWKNQFIGLSMIVVELMLGSFGYIFAFHSDFLTLSIRQGMFLIFLVIWLFKLFQDNRYRIKDNRLLSLTKNNPVLICFLVYLIICFLGVLNGFLHNYPLINIINDFNGYLFLLLAWPFVDILKKEKVWSLIQTMLAAATMVSLKTMIALYIFSHNLPNITLLVYKWIRDSRVGEITRVSLDNNFYRIFFQSHIFLLAIIFITALLIIFKVVDDKYRKYLTLIFILSLASILTSFSRSYWLGLVVGFGLIGLYLIIDLIVAKKALKRIFEPILTLLGLGIASLILMFAVVNFPIPTPYGGFGFGDLNNRLTIGGEAGSSRWNLLPSLFEKIRESVFLGSGFGTPVTYNSNDPRIKTIDNPTGQYTTTSFEWGYLDTITEIGVVGLLVYLFACLLVFWNGWKAFKNPQIPEHDKYLVLGLLISLIALAAVHTFSPYLNHPLGIGLIIICYSIFSSLQAHQRQQGG